MQFLKESGPVETCSSKEGSWECEDPTLIKTNEFPSKAAAGVVVAENRVNMRCCDSKKNFRGGGGKRRRQIT